MLFGMKRGNFGAASMSVPGPRQSRTTEETSHTFLFSNKVFGRRWYSPPKLGGVARSAGAVCSTPRSHLIDFPKRSLWNRCAAANIYKEASDVDNLPVCAYGAATPP
jgi:hypothetical protein